MQLIVGITTLVVVCLGVSTAAQKSCSLQLSNSVLRLGGNFFYSQYVLQMRCHCMLNILKSGFSENELTMCIDYIT